MEALYDKKASAQQADVISTYPVPVNVAARCSVVPALGNNDSDDDLDTDLVKAALEIGTKAFESDQWQDAEYPFNEALRVLHQLPIQQRTFCDIFDLHYQLAICAYHTHESPDAKEALNSLIEHQTSSDTQRACVHDAAHLLSVLDTRTGRIDRARSECEKTLQARRRLLGKRSGVSLESLTLMAHIYVLLNNRALAKSFLAIIPGERRDAALATVESSLGSVVEHLDFQSLLTPPMLRESLRSTHEVPCAQSRIHELPKGLGMDARAYGSASTRTNSPAPSPIQPVQRLTSFDSQSQTMRSTAVESWPLAYSTGDSMAMDNYISPGGHPMQTVDNSHTKDYRFSETYNSVNVSLPPQSGVPIQNSLSRKDILDKIGCLPQDRIEEAVCAGDASSLATLLAKKKGFWLSSFRKHVRPERVTALHFAALFGEIDMARRLLSSSFNVNDVPFGYKTTLTPLHFAIGARQVDMVEFLIANGAQPSEPESWSTLASQLMSRSWLIKTMSDNDKDMVPGRIIAIMATLLKHGWSINEPIDSSGRTVPHQAVSLWTGSYRWDLDLCASVTAFLCEKGADPSMVNREGMSSYDLALASDHQDLIALLEERLRFKGLRNIVAEPTELSAYLS